MRHRVTTRQGRDDDRWYACYGNALIGPYETQSAAAAAINRAAAAVAIDYAGLDCTPAEALDETFGTAEPGDERDRLCDLYYNAALNLLDGAEGDILERITEDDDNVSKCIDWVCTVCDYEWTGTSSECWNCILEAEDEAERGEEAEEAGRA
ncbi:MAG: hypothetical protein OXG04_00280 [Acidobacteria bacterium]|nr:hypothetical protein [Acidobacteriota bacterium]